MELSPESRGFSASGGPQTIEEFIEAFPRGKHGLADVINCTPQAITNWYRRGVLEIHFNLLVLWGETYPEAYPWLTADYLIKLNRRHRERPDITYRGRKTRIKGAKRKPKLAA